MKGDCDYSADGYLEELVGRLRLLRQIVAFVTAGALALNSNGIVAGQEVLVAVPVPTGQSITPTAARGASLQELDPKLPLAPDLQTDQAVAVSVSPNGKLLAIQTSGFNLHWDSKENVSPELSKEYVFLFDITGAEPQQIQALPIPNSFQGLAWDQSSDKIYVSGGRDDSVVELVRSDSGFGIGREIRLDHSAGLGLNVLPVTGGLAVSPDGSRLLIANLQNDSVSLVETGSGKLVAEQDLRPGRIDPKRRGLPGGTFPRTVTWISPDRAYVASERDREVLSLKIVGSSIHVTRRLPVEGQPVALLANRSGSRLYVTLDTTSQVAIIDTTRESVVEALNTTAPSYIYANPQKYGGANPNALALTPDQKTLLVSNGGQNSIAVVRLSDRARGIEGTIDDSVHRKKDDDDYKDEAVERSSVIGLVPTGWYPTGIAVSRNGRKWYVLNGKSPAGPNIGWCEKEPGNSIDDCHTQFAARATARPGIRGGGSLLLSKDQFISQSEKAGLLTIPPPTSLELARLTKQVAANNHFDRPEVNSRDEQLFSFLRGHIDHIVYVIKENRTYDQVLGDLEVGNGDPRITMFPEPLSPNHHAIARNFVTLDNFMVSGETSWTGWDWSVSAQTTDFREREEPLALRGIFGGETNMQGEIGTNRYINVGYPDGSERRAADSRSPSDPDILPGVHSIYAPDGPDGDEGKGYIWDAALRSGRTVRNWGFFGDERTTNPINLQLVHDAYAQKLQVFFPTKTSLMPFSDLFFADIYTGFPDFWRIREWKREFDEFVAKGAAPNLMLVRLGNDHFGNFNHAIDGVNTPETQMADNDYALGLLIDSVAKSPFAKDTLVISIEDDACDGPDHVEAHRSIALFAGPYVRQHAVISERYTTVSVIKTIEEILGLNPIGLNDALAAPMSAVFDPNVVSWSYQATVPDVLRSTKLPLPPAEHAHITAPRHSAAYWAKAMADQDFSGADRIEPISFNRELWRGLEGDVPYPTRRTGSGLGANRTQLLQKPSVGKTVVHTTNAR